jgi:hypothetical protein
MVVNFRTREISRSARKLARTPMLVKKKSVDVINEGSNIRCAQSSEVRSFKLHENACKVPSMLGSI